MLQARAKPANSALPRVPAYSRLSGRLSFHLTFEMMTIYSPKANSDLPDPAQDNASFADLICNQIHSFVSQQHQHGKPERISSQLLDLAGAVRHIADQYAVDHLPHFISAAGHADDGVFFDRSLISFNPAPSSDQENPEPSASSFDFFAGSPPAYYRRQ